MKNVCHLLLAGFFTVNGFFSGLTVRYPTLERLLTKISVEHPEIADEVRAHSAPSAMCGIHAQIESQPNSRLCSEKNHGAPQLFPVGIFKLSPLLLSTRLAQQSARLQTEATRAIFLPPPRLIA